MKLRRDAGQPSVASLYASTLPHIQRYAPSMLPAVSPFITFFKASITFVFVV